MKALELSVVTWNVHGFVGADGRRDPDRVAEILGAIDADTIALQEVDAGSDSRSDAFEALAARLGFTAIPGPTLERAGGRYGNLLLTRHPMYRVTRVDLSQPGFEPRGAIDAEIEVGGACVRVVATHLGLRRHERARQARTLCDALDSRTREAQILILLGDLNEWRRPLGRTGLAPLVRRFPIRTRKPTFPARAPVLALDRVLVDRVEARVRPSIAARSLARSASDHLPLRADIRL